METSGLTSNWFGMGTLYPHKDKSVGGVVVKAPN